MREVSNSLGLSFYGRIGDSIQAPRIPITQTLGCGGAVLDYDQDGRQDLVFAAAGGRIRERDSDPGALFRNIGAMVDVGIPAGFGDTGYSQGMVVGDYNDDGFADILVLNLGPNRLFRNNGDGSFSDASASAGRPGERASGVPAGRFWMSIGTVINDIVIVNYCDSRDPLEQPCFDSNGSQINCYPLEYRAAQDQILIRPRRRHVCDTTTEWISDATRGRGLGIVAGRLDGNPTVHLHRQRCVTQYVLSLAAE